MSSTLRVELELDAEVEDALDLGVEHVARQPVLRDAEAHHAAGAAGRPRGSSPRGRGGAGDRRPRGPTGRRRRPARACRDSRARRRELPAALDRLVAEEALDRVDADRLVELAAVAGALAGVIADAAHDRRAAGCPRSARARPPRSRRPRRGYSQPWMFSPAGQAWLHGGRRST